MNFRSLAAASVATLCPVAVAGAATFFDPFYAGARCHSQDTIRALSSSCEGFRDGTFGAVGFAKASADLATGEMKNLAKGQAFTLGGAVGSAGAFLRDQIGFVSSESFDGVIAMRVAGALSGPWFNNGPFLSASLSGQFGNTANLGISYLDGQLTVAPWSALYSVTALTLDYIEATLYVPFTWSESTRDFNLQAALQVIALPNTPGEFVVDFSNTATLQVVRPAGVDIRSASGVFLSATTSSVVPEPSLWSLLLMGGLSLFAAAQRRSAGSLSPARLALLGRPSARARLG